MDTKIKSPIPHYKPNFTSRLNPIKPFTVKTTLGSLDVFEVSEKQLSEPCFIKDIVSFWFKHFSKDTKDPAWLQFLNPEKHENLQYLIDKYVEEIFTLFKNDDGHSTLLVAKNKKKELCGAILSYGFDIMPPAKNIVMYVDCIAVDDAYRHNNLATILLNKSVEAEKEHFTDIFLAGDNCARGFYNKLGFKALNKKSKAQSAVEKYMAEERFDYPDYVTFLTKPIQKDKPRWYDAIYKDLKELED